jgi:hypothetical protein
VGKTGLISKYLKKNIKFKKIYSLRNFKKNSSNIKKIEENDIVFLLSNPGSLVFCEKNKKKVEIFLKNIDKFFSYLNKKITLIFFSSDAVYFKKLEYGKMKLNIENKIKKSFKKYYILRLCKVFSKDLNDDSEYKKIFLYLKNNKTYKVFHNQYCHYIEIFKLIKKIKKLIKNKKKIKYGTKNVFDEKIYLSRYDFAKKISAKYRLSNKYLKPSRVEDFQISLPKRAKLKNNFKFN